VKVKSTVQNDDIVQGESSKEKLLLHCCCAPCASSVTERLLPEYDITLLFYNPNIEPFEEYEKRLAEMNKLLAAIQNLQLISCDYDNDVFSEAVSSLRDSPEGRERCRTCFHIRFEKTAQLATGFDVFATTLTVSPYKDAGVINKIGEDLGKKYGVKFLVADFKKQEGFTRSVELSKKYNLYRQNYCGCKS